MTRIRQATFGNMSNENATQNHNLIASISYSLGAKLLLVPMKPAPAKAPEADALEDLGRATLRIVHDLKNQLNGLKLYATYLRKRFEREDRSEEERETVAKLIAGLDRAAREMTALVRYAQPIELRPQPRTDLRKIILSVANEGVQRVSGALGAPLPCDMEEGSLVGAFDPNVLADALNALTHEALVNAASKEPGTISIHVRRGEAATPAVAIEWRGLRPLAQAPASRSFDGYQSAYAAFAAKVIATHGGTIEFPAEVIRVSLPLAE
jgi:light-regulated signal transduction histidine kinase (bacteriophytochrome)